MNYMERIESDEDYKMDIDHAIYMDRKPLMDRGLTDKEKEILEKICVIHEKALKLMKESGD